MTHEDYMNEAIRLAVCAGEKGDVPVGAVVVAPDGTVIGRGYNRREEAKNALAHAETEAIQEACRRLGSWRLEHCSLYVTLEPCPMCAGAIMNARIENLYYGAKEPYSGSCGSVINLFMERYPWSPKIVGGILEEPCAELLRGFFTNLR